MQFAPIRSLVLVTTVFACSSFAHAEDITGKYNCAGTNVEGGAYTGSVEVAAKGAVYTVKWTFPDGNNYNGTGILDGKTLSVCWAYKTEGSLAVGVSVYTKQPDGSWSGKWAGHGGDKVLKEDWRRKT